jgi:hypothetical protein
MPKSEIYSLLVIYHYDRSHAALCTIKVPYPIAGTSCACVVHTLSLAPHCHISTEEMYCIPVKLWLLIFNSIMAAQSFRKFS